MEPAIGREAMYVCRPYSTTWFMLTDGSAASNCRSLLLKMPQEIKDQIYVLVCGGNLLHFNFIWSERIEFCHFKCESRTTEEDAQASFDNSTSP